MNARERMLARKAAPKPTGQISVKDDRSERYANFYPVYYWPHGTVTLGVLQRPEEGRPMSREAWQVLEGYYLKRGERPMSLRSILWHISEAICATWVADVGGVVDVERAIQVFEGWQRKLRMECIRTESGIFVHHFNRV